MIEKYIQNALWSIVLIGNRHKRDDVVLQKNALNSNSIYTCDFKMMNEKVYRQNENELLMS